MSGSGHDYVNSLNVFSDKFSQLLYSEYCTTVYCTLQWSGSGGGTQFEHVQLAPHDSPSTVSLSSPVSKVFML
jgi:hypothetical protein